MVVRNTTPTDADIVEDSPRNQRYYNAPIRHPVPPLPPAADMAITMAPSQPNKSQLGKPPVRSLPEPVMSASQKPGLMFH